MSSESKILLVDTQAIQEAQNSINEIETSLNDPSSLIHKMFQNKRDTIRYLAECYEILTESHTLEMRTNQIANYIIKKVSKIDEKGISKAWVYDTLPPKYKSHTPNPTDEVESTEWTKSSSLYTKIDYTTENKREIELAESQIKLLKSHILKLTNDSYISKIDGEQYHEHYIMRKAAQKLLADTLDNRRTVPINTIHLLLNAYEMANNKHAAGVYISLLKKFGAQKKDEGITQLSKIFSSKQFVKILKGHVRELHQSLEINTQEEAYENGFYGKKRCDECSSWRIIQETVYDYTTGKFKPPHLYCFACGQITKSPRVKLPLSRETPRITQEKTF